MSERILIIEDDLELGAQLVEHLRSAGFEPTWRCDGRNLPALADFELLVLDLMLPEESGLDILKRVRLEEDVPVLILSARNETPDKVRALKLGADDYMTKPFWPEELVERVRARLRRPVLRRGGDVDFDGLRLDFRGRTVTIDDRPVELTRVEFDLLAALARRSGSAVTRSALVEQALDPDRDGSPRTLDVHMSRLRKKVGRDRIQTVWGIGYRLRRGSQAGAKQEPNQGTKQGDDS